MSILNEIIANKYEEVKKLSYLDNLPVSSRDFLAIFREEKVGVIAELKARSPSAGKIVESYDPVSKAQQYVQGGADAISVLTDEKYFGGHLLDLQQVRQVVNVPLLCKDFFIDCRQVHHARLAGADACLLIVAALSDTQLQELKQEIEMLKMMAVIEIHDASELEQALKLNPKIIAINNRNLHTFSINPQQAQSLCDSIPSEIVVISASGIEMPQEIKKLPRRINGVLVGTALMRSDNPIQFLRDCR